MKKIMTCLAFLVFCVSVSFATGDAEYYSYSYARLSYVKGDVYIQRADDLGFEEGVVNLALIQGDKIGAREGRGKAPDCGHFVTKRPVRRMRACNSLTERSPSRCGDGI